MATWLDVPEGNRSTASSARSHEDSRQFALKASLNEKISGLAAVEKNRLLCEKAAAYDFVKSDPLRVYGKEETKVEGKHRKKSGQEEQPFEKQLEAVLKRKSHQDDQGDGRRISDEKLSDEKRPVRVSMKRKNKQDDIFKSFGKEHDSHFGGAMSTVDGKLKVNYSRFWRSDLDLGRWQQGLAHNKRHNALMLDARERSSENFAQELMDLTQKHNALFRQRYAVDSKELGKKSRNVAQVKDLQTQIRPNANVGDGRICKSVADGISQRKNALYDGEASVATMHTGRMSLYDIPPPRSLDEDMIIAFIERLLQSAASLEEAFHKLDTNKSRAVSFNEFERGVTGLGFRGNTLHLFQKLDTNQDGVVTLDEFMQLRPYMLKEMIRVLAVAKQIQHPESKSSIWLKRAKVELAKDQVLNELLDMDLNSKVPKARPGVSDSRRSSICSQAPEPSCDSQSYSTDCNTVGQRPGTTPAGNTETQPAAKQLRISRSLPQVRAKTMSLFIFGNAYQTDCGKAVLIRRVPQTMEKLLQVVGETVTPLIGPAESLLDSALQPVRTVEEVENGGTYLLKGKEALDPPPVFFCPRPPLDVVRYKRLCDAQIASQCEASSRPTTSSRPNTSTSTFSKGSFGSLFSDGAGPPVGYPHEQPACGKPLPICVTWQAEDRVRKELCCKGHFPVHKRYDLWTAVPRRAFSESAFDQASQRSLFDQASERSLWSAGSNL